MSSAAKVTRKYYILSKRSILLGFRNFRDIISMVAYNITSPIRRGIGGVNAVSDEMSKIDKEYTDLYGKPPSSKEYSSLNTTPNLRIKKAYDDYANSVNNRVEANRKELERRMPWLARLRGMLGRKQAEQATEEVAYLVKKMTKKGLNLTEAEKINVASILVENKYKKLLTEKYGMQ